MTDEPLLDIKQAALFLNVSETSLRRWTNDGRLACMRVGGRRERRFRRSDLVAFLERQPAHALISASVSGSATIAETDGDTQGSHLCGLYGTEGDRVGIAIAFLRRNSGQRTACHVLADAEARAAIIARVRVGEAGSAWGDRIVPCEAARSVEGQYQSLEEQFTNVQHSGVESVLLICDMWELATRFGMAGLMAYEAGYAERIAKRFAVATLCLYDVRRFSGTDLLDGLRRHRDMFRYPDEPVRA